MTGLERHAHRLVGLSRAGDDPTPAQLHRLHSAIAVRIAAGGALGVSAVAASSKAALSGALVKGLVAASAIATGAAGFLALGGTQELDVSAATLQAPAPARVVEVGEPSAPIERVEEDPVQTADTPSLAPRTAKQPVASLRLEDEAALLAGVQGALRAGKPTTALSMLESYDKKYSAGMLRTEADAARVFALCAAGRVEKARSAAARFVQRYPSAPATARVQAACK